ncbi:retrotransposon protein [Cucumis melo var. makuwa]|uniref:Retrotransposon protein n=1 Tax=Cucumis melo var. makuwa TaxID=1194695 RepID=A0A5D3DCS9_CUCMM|nr:retrotransposon protein [Cucumis melo var. makuwa]
MTNWEDFDDVDEGDFTYTTTTVVEDIQCIKTTKECMATSSRAPKHVWTKENEDTLVECLVELVSTRGWKSDNVTFQSSYLVQLVCMMVEKLHGCHVRATIVIDCIIKTLKLTFQAIAKMRGPAYSGFGWNDDAKCIIAEKKVFNNWSHPTAKGLLNKPFPYYDEHAYVFERDRTTGRFAKIFVDVRFNEPTRYGGLTCWMGTRSSYPCTARGLTCPRRMYAHHDLLTRQIVGPDQADRREKGKASGREFLGLLREIPDLSNLDRALCQRELMSRMDDMQSFIEMTDDERKNFCRVFLRDIFR